MALAKILVPVRGDGKGDNVLAHAAVLARRFSAHVVVAHCRPRPEDMLPYGMSVPFFMKQQIAEQTSQLADEEEQKLRGEFDELTARFGLKVVERPEAPAVEATASWIEETGKQVDVIRRNGRLADLICVAKPDVDRNLGFNTLKAALFHTGRPVMMCPPRDDAPETVGERLTIGWNGSVEAARAVALSLPIIEKATEVTILSGGDEMRGAGAEDLVDYLAVRGVTPSVERFRPGKNAGAELLRLSAEAGADLLLMGAYGDSHERETVFGGNTQLVVDKANMPVLLVH